MPPTNLTFSHNFHSSVPTVWTDEFDRVFNHVRDDFPTLKTPWLDDITVYAWISTVVDPWPFGDDIYGMSISGNSTHTWMSLEFSNESGLEQAGFASPPMAQKYGVIAHEYYHVYQRTLSLAMREFAIKWLIEGTAAVVESLVVLDLYDIDYFSAGQSYQNMTRLSIHPERLESYEEDEVNYSDSVFMVLCLLDLLNDPPLAFVNFWSALDSDTSWRNVFLETFGMSVDAFYANVRTNCTVYHSLTELTNNLTLADIVP